MFNEKIMKESILKVLLEHLCPEDCDERDLEILEMLRENTEVIK